MVTRDPRQTGGAGVTVWLTGLSAAGKSTVAMLTAGRLAAAGCAATVLDGDELRRRLSADLGFSLADRTENLRRVAHLATDLAASGQVVIVATISPLQQQRDRARGIHAEAGARFFEVYLDVPLDVCEARDPKGLYAQARAGVITDFTGIGSPYEPPEDPDLRLRAGDPPDRQAALIVGLLGPLPLR